MITSFLSLGTNLGDKMTNLAQAIVLLNAHQQVTVKEVSKWLENPAIEGAGPDDFLNGAVKLKTSLSPRELLNLIREIEKQIDPERDERGRKMARKIDIDILLYGDQVIEEEGLSIPHPRMQDRYFIMQPLKEIEPNLNEIMAKLKTMELV